MSQTIPIGTRVWVSTVAPRLTGPVARDRQYAGTVLRQNAYETTHYPVRLDGTKQVIVANDSMITPME